MPEHYIIGKIMERLGMPFDYVSPVHHKIHPNAHLYLYRPKPCFMCGDECFQFYFDSVHYVKHMEERKAFVQAPKNPDGSVIGSVYPYYCDNCHKRIQLLSVK